jgi:hypothetical protein
LFSAGHARDLDPPPKLSKTHTNDRATPRDLWSIFGFSFVDPS